MLVRMKCDSCLEYKECPMTDLWDWLYYCEECIKEIEEYSEQHKMPEMENMKKLVDDLLKERKTPSSLVAEIRAT